MIKDFIRIGRDIVSLGLATYHGGNLSIKKGEKIYITRRGAMLSNLNKDSIIAVGMEEDSAEASIELPVHREIYRRTNSKAIVHAHPIYAVALSIIRDMIRPIDVEGAVLLNDIPVVVSKAAVGSKEIAKAVSEILKKRPIVLLRGHGSFASGETLYEALSHTSTLEVSCRIMTIVNMLSKGGK